MNIYGLTKTTLLDYPGLVASTIFVGNCNFQCPFCHNLRLVNNPSSYPLISEDELFSHIEKRRNIISGICVTGGEPTIQVDIIDFLIKLRKTGLKIKLDTNGYNPEVLEQIIEMNLIDYVAMDIKSGRDNYSIACGKNIKLSNIDSSIQIISESNIDFEFRTTCVKGIHNELDFVDIASWIPRRSKYYLQNYKSNDVINNESLSSFSKEELTKFLTISKMHIANTFLRGVD